MRILGLVSAAAILIVAVTLATTPWRVHGGRFVTEYLLAGGIAGLLGLGVLAATIKWT